MCLPTGLCGHTPTPRTLPRARQLRGQLRTGSVQPAAIMDSQGFLDQSIMPEARSTWQDSLLRSSMDWGWMSTHRDSLAESMTFDDEASFEVLRQHVGRPPCHHCIATVYDRHFEREKDKAEERLPRQLKPKVQELLSDLRAFQYPRRRNIQHEIREKEIRPPSRQSPTRTPRALVEVEEVSSVAPSWQSEANDA
ncbi:unnamed protein product [Symbiodinium natans]|uniref:Uncharacterized protein n=1 Tax=Symbiodinium natans TaxID=878477 RepID=A0A812U1N0_9DINO|nr:unnamed protein product [Symbiodinium natans]